MKTNAQSILLDYRTLRLLMGLIAFLLPPVVTLIASTALPSISASYYTQARDEFVGLLFIVGSLWLAYNGRSTQEMRMSKVAALAAIGVAVFPESPGNSSPGSWVSTAHVVCAVTMFSILAYFCFGPFRQFTKGQPGKKRLRSNIYLVCGWIMVGCMVFYALATRLLPGELVRELRLTYWTETIALAAFGVAWMVASKVFSVFADPEDKLYLFR